MLHLGSGRLGVNRNNIFRGLALEQTECLIRLQLLNRRIDLINSNSHLITFAEARCDHPKKNEACVAPGKDVKLHALSFLHRWTELSRSELEGGSICQSSGFREV